MITSYRVSDGFRLEAVSYVTLGKKNWLSSIYIKFLKNIYIPRVHGLNNQQLASRLDEPNDCFASHPRKIIGMHPTPAQHLAAQTADYLLNHACQRAYLKWMPDLRASAT